MDVSKKYQGVALKVKRVDKEYIAIYKSRSFINTQQKFYVDDK